MMSAWRSVLGHDRTARNYYAQPSPRDAFALLRSRVEAAGAFVLLKGNMGNYQSVIELDAFRGFAIADHIAPFVVINDNDSAPLVLHAPAQGGRQPSSNGASVSSPNERDHQRAHAQETDGGPSPYVVRRHRVGPALLDKGDDELKSWLTNNRDSLPFDEEVVPEHINRKIARGKRHVYRLCLLILYHTGHALRMCQWKPLPLPQLHPHGATNSSLATLICPDRGFEPISVLKEVFNGIDLHSLLRLVIEQPNPFLLTVKIQSTDRLARVVVQ